MLKNVKKKSPIHTCNYSHHVIRWHGAQVTSVLLWSDLQLPYMSSSPVFTCVWVTHWSTGSVPELYTDPDLIHPETVLTLFHKLTAPACHAALNAISGLSVIKKNGKRLGSLSQIKWDIYKSKEGITHSEMNLRIGSLNTQIWNLMQIQFDGKHTI